MKRLLVLAITALIFGNLEAQEIKATVKINAPQLQRTDRKVFDVLESTLREWLNNTKWTEDQFTLDERIKCSFTINIKQEVGDNGFSGELLVQSTRPVFGSGYETPLLSHMDKDFDFVYDQYQAFDFSRDNIDNNLTATLAFYVYTMLGLDYDSFSLYGGDPYHAIALQIVNNIPPAMAGRFKGWSASDGGKNRNRFWINENLRSPRLRPYRAAMYNYHRKGLDEMTANVEKSRGTILTALEEIEKSNTAYLNSMIVQMFTNAKRDEIIEMWKQGTKPQRERIVQVMGKIDPGNTQRYLEIGI